MTGRQREAILTDLRRGMPIGWVAAEHKRALRTVSRLAREAGVPVTRQRMAERLVQHRPETVRCQEAALASLELKGELAHEPDPWAARLAAIPPTAAAAYLEGVRR